MDQLMHAYAVRAICFMEENGMPASHAMDGNDLQATHFVAYYGDEPVASMRVRWFSDFAKLERSAFRKEYRDIRTVKFAADFVFEHVARKGYSRVITHAKPPYTKLWQKMFGFKVVDGKPPLRFAGDENEYVELLKILNVPENAITTETNAIVMSRTEGKWDFASTTEPV
jgi:hypothetical protein